MNKAQLDRYIRRCQKSFDEIDHEAPYEWKVFGTLPFRYFIGILKSRRLLYRWLATIRKPMSPHMFSWFAVIELDRWNNDIRIYVLLGGSELSFQPRWILRWQELSGGDATISDYRRGAFSKYVTKETQANRYFEVAMNLCGWGLLEIDQD